MNTLKLNIEGFDQVSDRGYHASPFSWAAVSAKVAAQHIADACEVLNKYANGNLTDTKDLFGDDLTADRQMEMACEAIAEHKARLDKLISA